jgi:CDGSH-type Zn-finger protein
MITLKVRQNGSILVEGEDVKLVDWNGNEYYVPKKPFAICRCGASKQKPFCDSSHKTCGFVGDEPAPGPKVPPTEPPPTPSTA